MTTKAFDNALYIPPDPAEGDAVEILSPGPPLVTQYNVYAKGAPGVVVAASVPAAAGEGQVMIAGPAPDYAWEAEDPAFLPPADAPGQTLVSGNAPDFAWAAATVSVPGLPTATQEGQSLVAGPAPDYAWQVGQVQLDLPAASAPGQIMVSGAAPGFDWEIGTFPTELPTPTGPNLALVTGQNVPFAYGLQPMPSIIQPTAQNQVMLSNASPAWALSTISNIMSLGGAITVAPTAANQVLVSNNATPAAWTLSSVASLVSGAGAVMQATGGTMAQAANLVFAAAATLTTRLDGGSPTMSRIDNFTLDMGTY